MTLWDLLGAMLRRWPVVLVGAVLTGTMGLLAIRDPGVYFTRTEVVFLAPSIWYPNILQTTPESVIITAGVVAKRIVGAGDVIKYGSPDATIIGTTNTREGTSLRLADTGGQWAANFVDPIIVVDVVAPTEARARELQNAAVSRIRDELAEVQREQGVIPNQEMTITVAPDATQIYRVRGDSRRALVMTALLGVVATVTAVGLLEARARRREDARRGVLLDA